MDLQDVRVGSIVNVYKACGHVAIVTIVQHQHYGPLTWHRYSVKRLDGTAPHC
jgi:hypothetical protein